MDAKEQWIKYCNGRCMINKKEGKVCNVSCGLCEHIFVSAYHSRDEEVELLRFFISDEIKNKINEVVR